MVELFLNLFLVVIKATVGFLRNGVIITADVIKTIIFSAGYVLSISLKPHGC